MVARPLKVAFLAPTPPPVMGPSIATTVVFSEEPPSDIELVHLDTADRRSLSTLGKIDLGNVWQALRMYAGLFSILLLRRPRVVYVPISQTPIGYVRDTGLICLGWIFGRRIVLHLRGGDFRAFYDRCGRPLRFWIRWTLRRAAGVIVLGECLKRQFTPFVEESRIFVVPNGEDFPELDRVARVYERPRRHVLYLGNLIPPKGAGDLLRAVPGVLARHPDTRFTFAGEFRQPEFERWARGFVAERGLEDPVRFVGPVDRDGKTRLLKEADLFVFPSTREGHPWVIVEALAAGLPVVTCDVGCIRESVIDGLNGRLVPPRDPARLAAAITGLFDDPETLRAMAAASRSHYEHGFRRTHFRSRLFGALRAAGNGAPPCG